MPLEDIYFYLVGTSQVAPSLDFFSYLANVSDYLELVIVQKLGPSGQQNATRCGLWWVEILKTRDQFREAATVYFRICSQVMLNFFDM